MQEYTHLTLEEREKFFTWKEQKMSLREIARRLGRSHTTFSREKKRNAKYGKQYIPCKAHEKAVKRGKDQRWQAPLKEPLVFLYVREHLRRGWSPQTIAGRLPIDHPGYVIHHETIYRYVYSKQGKKEKLSTYLTCARKKRMKKNGRSIHRNGKIPNAVSIDLRPKEIERRDTPGHWETDDMEGKKTDTTVISATVERMTRVVRLRICADKTAREKTQTLTETLIVYPQAMRQTMTADNGKENSYHERISTMLHLSMYFCHSYHSWEKGTVENTIGRLRRFIPKGMSIDRISEKNVAQIEDAMNNTPRKCLGYLTPYEKMRHVMEKEGKRAVLTG